MKYETIDTPKQRKLIIKNIRAQDAGTYFCESGDSKLKFTLTVGKEQKSTQQTSSSGVQRPTFDQESFSSGNMDTKKMGFVKLPNNLDGVKLRNFVLTEQREKDMESKKKWVRCPDCWNSWMINPVYAN